MQNKKALTIAILCVLLTTLIHVYLTSHHYDVEFGATDGKAFCNINEKFNCDAVAASEYSKFILGIPMALLGVVSNLLLLLFLIVDYFAATSNQQIVRRYSFWLSAFILSISVWMGGISFLKLGTFCIVCISVYLLSLISFLLIWKAYPADSFTTPWKTDFIDSLKNQKWLPLSICLIPFMAYVLHGMKLDSINAQNLREKIPSLIAEWQINPEKKFDLGKGLVLNEQEHPKMTIVEFADFGCPHCKHAFPTIDAFVKSHKDVKLVFKVYALDGTCNPNINGSSGGGERCQMGYTIYCAEKLSLKGWSAHHFFFERQMEIMKSNNLETHLEDFSKLNGINYEELKACVKSNDAFEAIKFQSNEGHVAGIGGTPSFFINGKQLSGAQILSVLNAAYESLK